MKVRVVRQPTGTLDGTKLDLYRVGHAYDVPVILATYLVVEGYALVELRGDQEPHEVPAWDRRRRST